MYFKTLFLLSFISISLFADTTNGWNRLHESVYKGDLKESEKALKSIDIDSKTKAGLTSLHIAVKNRDLKTIKYLIEHEADIDSQDNKGFSPLYYAVLQNRVKIARYLLQNEADPNLPNYMGNAPIHQIAYKNRFEMLKLFTNFSVNLKLKNSYGMLPYQFAQRNGNNAMKMEILSIMGK